MKTLLLFWAGLSCGFSVVWVFWPSGLFLSVRVLLSFVFGIPVPCRLVVCLFGGLVIAYFASVHTCEVGRMLTEPFRKNKQLSALLPRSLFLVVSLCYCIPAW